MTSRDQARPIVDPNWIKDQFENGNGTRLGLAEALGCGRDVVSKILSGTRKIKAAELPVIERYFGIGDSQSQASQRSAHQSPTTGDGAAWRRLMDQVCQLTDEELDFLTVSAEGLRARRSLLNE